MTKHNKLNLRIALVSGLLSYVTYLFIGLATTGTPTESAIGQLGSFVIGTFAVIGIVTTLVMFVVGEDL